MAPNVYCKQVKRSSNLFLAQFAANIIRNLTEIMIQRYDNMMKVYDTNFNSRKKWKPNALILKVCFIFQSARGSQ